MSANVHMPRGVPQHSVALDSPFGVEELFRVTPLCWRHVLAEDVSQAFPEKRCVGQGHVGPLPLKWRHRVRRVTEDAHTRGPLAPATAAIAVPPAALRHRGAVEEWGPPNRLLIRRRKHFSHWRVPARTTHTYFAQQRAASTCTECDRRFLVGQCEGKLPHCRVRLLAGKPWVYRPFFLVGILPGSFGLIGGLASQQATHGLKGHREHAVSPVDRVEALAAEQRMVQRALPQYNHNPHIPWRVTNLLRTDRRAHPVGTQQHASGHVHPSTNWHGSLSEERGRSILCDASWDLGAWRSVSR
eukprot:scaffold134784_cov32-Tisochrysis_lutea.AAC.6